MHHREGAIANRDPSAGAHHLGDKLTSQQGGIPRREHQCIMEDVNQQALPTGRESTSIRDQTALEFLILPD